MLRLRGVDYLGSYTHTFLALVVLESLICISFAAQNDGTNIQKAEF